MGGGRCKDYATATSKIIAAATAEQIDRSVTYRSVESGGAMKAEALTAELLWSTVPTKGDFR